MDQPKTISSHAEDSREGSKIVAVLGAQAVLALDLRMMLSDAGFDVLDLPPEAPLPEAANMWHGAIVDIGAADARMLQVLSRLAQARIPHVVLSDEADVLPEGLSTAQLRGHLFKPVVVERLLGLL